MICLPLQTMDNALWNTKNWKNKVRIFIFIYQRKKDYVSFPLCSNLYVQTCIQQKTANFGTS